MERHGAGAVSTVTTSAAAWVAGASSVPMVVVGAVVLGARVAGAPIPAPCLFTEITGLPCPACGATRAAESLLRLDVSGAAAQLPAALLVVTMAVMTLLLGLAALLGRTLGRRVPAALLTAVGVLLIANWIWQIAAA